MSTQLVSLNVIIKMLAYQTMKYLVLRVTQEIFANHVQFLMAFFMLEKVKQIATSVFPIKSIR